MDKDVESNGLQGLWSRSCQFCKPWCDYENMSTGQAVRAGWAIFPVFFEFFLENFGLTATIRGGGCEQFAAKALSQLWCLVGWEEMVVNSLMSYEMDAGLDVDPVEEMRLRTWARKNYTPLEERDEHWHPIVLEEMDRKDHESSRMAFVS